MGQGRVKGNGEKKTFTEAQVPLEHTWGDPVLPPCGHFW